MSFDLSGKEQRLLHLVKKFGLSPSHEVDHLLRVAEYCYGLANTYGADKETVTAAALVHDIARTKTEFRGGESAREGARLANDVLLEAGYSNSEIEKIVKCVAQHDQPELEPDTLEAKILKEADFLDGFGARGVLRSLIYAGETGGGVVEGLGRLKVKMKQRLESLRFIEAKRLAWKQYRFAQLFLEELEKGYTIDLVSYPGKFIVIEGISGSGKDTQATKLAQNLENEGRKVLVVNHPTDYFKTNIWKVWREEIDDRASELLLLMADRIRVVTEKIFPALQRGDVVISTRSGLDARIYQKNDHIADELVAYLFNFEPLPDAMVFLDVSPEVAWERILAREEQGKDDKGFFAQKQQKQQEGYQKLLEEYPTVVTVDASREVDLVAAGVWQAVKPFIL